MNLNLVDNIYYEDDYKIEIEPMNAEKTNFHGNKHEFIFKNKEINIITIIFKNEFLESGFSGLVKNIIAILAGAYAGRKLGGPFDLKMSLRVLSDEDICIKTQNYQSKEPFQLIKGDCEILENKIITNDEYKNIWIKYTIIPMFILFLFVSMFIGYALLRSNILIIYIFIAIFLYIKFGLYIKNMLNL